MRPSTAEIEAAKIATLFEDQVQHGLISYDGNTRFGDSAQQWVDNAQIAPKTHVEYNGLLKRILPALGHIRLDRLQAKHLEELYKNLKEAGIKENVYGAVSTKLDKIIANKKMTGAELARQSGIGKGTANTARRGESISMDSAKKICTFLDMPVEEVFTINKDSAALSDVRIRHHHRLIASVLEKAKRERLVPFNVASEHVEAPKVKRKEAKYLNDEEAQRFLSLTLQETDIRIKTAFFLLLFTGVRRGELCGFSWQDVDEKNGLIHVKRASQYLTGYGVFEVPTKTESSVRAIKTPLFVFEVLTEYRAWWNRQKLIYGKDWQGKDERLFIQDDGKPINPGTINFWLNGFLKRHSLPHITPHSLRNTFASLQIASGVDIRTLQDRTGHAQSSTLLNIYSHEIRTAQEAASDALENILMPKAK